MEPSQKRKLRSQAHSLKPVVMLGNQGLTDNVQSEINQALNDHELIKIRIAGADKEDRNVIAQTICEKQGADLIQEIGHIIAVYRKNPDKHKKPSKSPKKSPKKKP